MPVFAGVLPYRTWQQITATVQNDPSGSVIIRLYANNVLLLSAVDDGSQGGPPFTVPGAVGIRTDNSEMKFENFMVTQLTATERLETVPAITNLSISNVTSNSMTLRWPRFTTSASHFFRAAVLSASTSAHFLPVSISNINTSGGTVQAQINSLPSGTQYQVFVYHSTNLSNWSLPSNVATAQTQP
jgi:hypothetical protein